VDQIAHPVEVRAAEEAHLVQWLSKRLGHPLKTPDLTRFGFKLMGGRLLPAASGSAALLMYDNAQGNRLTLYVRAGAGAETAFRFQQDGEVATFAWMDQGFGYAVMGAGDRQRLLPVAEGVYHELNGWRRGEGRRLGGEGPKADLWQVTLWVRSYISAPPISYRTPFSALTMPPM